MKTFKNNSASICHHRGDSKFVIAVAVIFALLCVFSTGQLRAEIINVPDDYETIQEAIDNSENGDVILVAPGVYRETINFGGRAILVTSHIHLDDDPAFIEETIIDGEEERPGVIFVNEEGLNSILQGFTIQNCFQNWGAAIDCQRNANPTLRHLIIRNNYAREGGGGIHCSREASPLIENCVLIQNSARFYGTALTATVDAYPIVRNTVFAENQHGGQGHGSAIWVESGGIELDGVEFYRNSGITSAAIFSSYASEVTIKNSTFKENVARVIVRLGYSEDVWPRRTQVNIDRVLFVQNGNDNTTCQIVLGGCVANISHMTIADNISNDMLMSIWHSDFEISNSIIYHNDGIIDLVGPIEEDEYVGAFDYCDLEGGVDALDIRYNVDFTWGENNIDADPLFVDPENGDYHLSADSPCIDAGDPDSPLDPDGTRADMGALYHHQVANTLIGGRVFNQATEQPIPNASVRFNRDTVLDTDDNGEWEYAFPLRSDDMEFSLEITAPEYVPVEIFDTISQEDTLYYEIGMTQANLVLTPEGIVVSIPQNSIEQFDVLLSNTGNGPLNFTTSKRMFREPDYEVWELRESIMVSEQVDDDPRITGITFAEGHFYTAGHAFGANLIYVQSADGELVRTFPQPLNNSRYGVTDLTWDGEYLYLVAADEIIVIDLDGEEQYRFLSGFNPASIICWDPEQDMFWIGTRTSNINLTDREGNVARIINRDGHRFYGIGYYPEDPDGYNLYINTYSITASIIYKANTQTGEKIEVFTLPREEFRGVQESIHITNQFDIYNWVMLSLVNDGSDDRIDIWHLADRTDWMMIEPSASVVPAGDDLDMIVTLSTMDLPLERFEGEIVFTHDGIGGTSILPIIMTVTHPDGVDLPSTEVPVEFALNPAFPNPFNSQTVIRYDLPKASVVSLTIYDVRGRLVATLAEGLLSAGSHSVVWDGANLSTGVYLVKLEVSPSLARTWGSGENVFIQKAVLVK